MREERPASPETFAANHHFVELDSLRGVAALTVLLGHFTNIFADDRLLEAARRTPLLLAFAAHEAVILFFLLSGFVLSLQFLKGRRVGYGGFAVKRVFRIYVPYLVAVGLAIVASRLLYTGPIPALSRWFNAPWSSPFRWKYVVEHVVFLGSFQSDRFDPVIWSLTQEMRISLLFPLLAAATVRLSARQNLFFACALSAIGLGGSFAWTNVFETPNDYLITLHYMGIFVLGYLLARHRNEIYARCRGLSSLRRGLILLLGVLLYTGGRWVPGRRYSFGDVPIALGAAIFLVSAFCFPGISRILRSRPARFLGEISYSLYLYHAIVLLATVHLFYGAAPLGALLAASLAASIAAAWIAQRLVESPAIRVGKRLAERRPA